MSEALDRMRAAIADLVDLSIKIDGEDGRAVFARAMELMAVLRILDEEAQ